MTLTNLKISILIATVATKFDSHQLEGICIPCMGPTLTRYMICAYLLRCFLAKFGIAIAGFSSERKELKLKNWVYFEQIIVKSMQSGQNWVLFYRKWYANGRVIRQKIGMEKFKFLRFDRHIHI